MVLLSVDRDTPSTHLVVPKFASAEERPWLLLALCHSIDILIIL